eukprot:8881461-Karenia_brevis.AAC.1
MLSNRDFSDIPCIEWTNEDLSAAERAGHFVIPQFLKDDRGRWERGELADDTGGRGPQRSKRGGKPRGNSPPPAASGSGRERSQRRQQ